MRGFQVAALLGIAWPLCLAATAFAKVSFLTLQNNEPRPVSVDWRLSTVPSCDTFQEVVGIRHDRREDGRGSRSSTSACSASSFTYRRGGMAGRAHQQDSDTLVVVN